MATKKNTPNTEPAAAWQNRIVGEGEVAAVDLVPHPQNWRKHPASQGTVLAQTLDGVGWVQRVIVNKRTGRMLDGHLRAELARKQGEQTPVPVVYVDLSEDEERTVLATLDPIAGMAIADEATLAGLVRSIEDADLRSVAGTIAQTLNVDVDGKGEAGKDTEAPIDRAEELRQKWGVESGQMWQLGEHRLICGDCTDASVVVRLLNGEKPALMVTDPPYGVEYDPMFRNEAFGAAVRRTGIVQNDNRSDWRQAWNLFTGDVVYCWSSMLNANTLLSSFTDIGFDIRAEIIWSKPHFPFGRGHYVAQHESCWYFVRKGKTSGWTRDNAQSTVWEIELDSTADGGHGTQKPLECMLRPIRNHGDSSSIVYEPFSGSGTTIIACENLGRRCRAVEIAPGYVAVALERWAVHTGKVPTLVEGTPSGGDGDAVKAGAGA